MRGKMIVALTNDPFHKEKVINKDMSADAIRKTEKCRCGFACLDANSRHPLCPVNYAFGENLMFLDCKADIACPYRSSYGGRDICSCPTHYSLHSHNGRSD